MLQQARDAYDDGDGYVLSVFAGLSRPESTDDEVIAEIANAGMIPNRALAVTTAAEIRRRGFELIADAQLPGRVNVILGTLITATTIDRFVAAFRPARENPTWPAWRRPR